jgi:hypothetical protein
MADLSEVWAGLRTALLSDDELVALLGSSDAIYRQFPGTSVLFPSLVFKVSGLGLYPNDSFTGRKEPGLQIDVYATEPNQFDAIFARLENAWTIPINHREPIDTENFRISRLKILNAIEVGPVRLLADNRQLRMWSVETELRVLPLSS